VTITRRGVLTIGAGLCLAGAAGAAYARFIEPAGSFAITRHTFRPRVWHEGLKLRVVALSDLHCGSAHMSLGRIERIVDLAHALEPDLIVLLGDYVTRARYNVHEMTPAVWSRALSRLRAPLGVHTILGNHEYWNDPVVQARGQGDPVGKLALLDAGLPVMENTALRLSKDGHPFWVVGLADQIAFIVGTTRWRKYRGIDDLAGALGRAQDGAPVILLAHEPDMFARLPSTPGAGQVAVAFAGHTHGGQIALMGWAPYVPSDFGQRYRYGRITEQGCDLIVSGGLGTSGPAVRFGVPPEIVVADLG
jgi:uncharacterized protein